MTIEQYIANQGNWSVYHTTEDPALYEGKYEQFDKYLYTHNEFVKHLDEYDEDLYNEDMICIYKYYYPKEKYFYYTITIFKTCPGIETGNLEFKQKLAYNEELTVDYIESLRKLFNI